MDIVGNIIKYLKKGQDEKEGAPEGLCPNCWGRQEYGGKFFIAIKQYGQNANIKEGERGWIQDWNDKHLLDISLVKNQGYNMCSHCKTRYKEED